MKLTEIEIIADEGKYVARKGTDNYFTRGTLLKGETLEDFVEVEELPNEELKQIKEQIKEKIKEYDISGAVNEFTLNGNKIWIPRDIRVSLANSIEIESRAKKLNTQLWFNGIKYIIPINQAKKMLSELELYALECYNKTQEHLFAIDQFSTVQEVENYNYKIGYPEKLVF